MKSIVGLEAALVKPPAEYPGNFFEGANVIISHSSYMGKFI